MPEDRSPDISYYTVLIFKKGVCLLPEITNLFTVTDTNVECREHNSNCWPDGIANVVLVSRNAGLNLNLFFENISDPFKYLSIENSMCSMNCFNLLIYFSAFRFVVIDR